MRVIKISYRKANQADLTSTALVGGGVALAWLCLVGGLLSSIGMGSIAIFGLIAMSFESHFPLVTHKITIRGKDEPEDEDEEEGDEDDPRAIADDEDEEPKPPMPVKRATPLRDALVDAAKKKAANWVAGQVKRRL